MNFQCENLCSMTVVEEQSEMMFRVNEFIIF